MTEILFQQLWIFCSSLVRTQWLLGTPTVLFSGNRHALSREVRRLDYDAQNSVLFALNVFRFVVIPVGHASTISSLWGKNSVTPSIIIGRFVITYVSTEVNSCFRLHEWIHCEIHIAITTSIIYGVEITRLPFRKYLGLSYCVHLREPKSFVVCMRLGLLISDCVVYRFHTGWQLTDKTGGRSMNETYRLLLRFRNVWGNVKGDE
jgi:hypothetical protein